MTCPFRIVPPEIEALLPPHRIEFHPEDPNRGRSCGACGFAVPQGTRYVHQEWCEARQAARRAAEANSASGWDVQDSRYYLTLRRHPYVLGVSKERQLIFLATPWANVRSIALPATATTRDTQIAAALEWFNGLAESEKQSPDEVEDR